MKKIHVVQMILLAVETVLFWGHSFFCRNLFPTSGGREMLRVQNACLHVVILVEALVILHFINDNKMIITNKNVVVMYE